MVMPSSGTISMQDLRDEFGGSGTISLNAHYRGGSLVPDITPNSGVPTSGTIGLSDFYGASAGVRVMSSTVAVQTGSTASVGIATPAGQGVSSTCYAFVARRNSNQNITAPSGWSLLGTNGEGLSVFVADDSSVSGTNTFSTTSSPVPDGMVGIIVRLRNGNVSSGSTIVHVAGGGGTTINTNYVTSDGTVQRMLLACFVGRGSSISFTGPLMATPPSGMTLLQSYAQSGVGLSMYLYSQYASAGTTNRQAVFDSNTGSGLNATLRVIG